MFFGEGGGGAYPMWPFLTILPKCFHSWKVDFVSSMFLFYFGLVRLSLLFLNWKKVCSFLDDFDEKLVGSDLESNLGTLFGFHYIYLFRFLVGGGRWLTPFDNLLMTMLMYSHAKLVKVHQCLCFTVSWALISFYAADLRSRERE